MNKSLVYLIIALALLACAIPAMYFGFTLALWFHTLAVIPFPAMAVIMAAFIFMHKAESHL